MNSYEGKICPYCKTALKEDDDIVLCSDCDMPHHKSCWIENNGCTTFGCQGTASYNDEAETTSNTEKLFCTKCGAENDVNYNFCSRCGAELTNKNTSSDFTQQTYQYSSNNGQATQQSYQYTPNNGQATQQSYQYTPNNGQATHQSYQYTLNNGQATQQSYQYTPNNGQATQQSYQYTPNNGQYAYNQNTYAGYNGQNPQVDETTIRLIGPKAEYYVPKFNEMKGMNKKVSWNWAAFFLAPYWMIYRKMYPYGIGMLVAWVLLSFLPLFSFFVFGVDIAIGLFGNYLYMMDLEKKSRQSQTMGEPYRTQYIQNNIGVNQGIAIVAFVVYLFAALLISMGGIGSGYYY